ncbi:hypothetical protein SSX86_012354 [Deinandra increscens subsp. villosa]|uniref:3-hydroxyisobutyryl-CoA hydrolase n=1 Tax=Deinandra increscens subsp. villosa TaxID=3103831 RepID=A0AAP0DBS0_9ASTR
MNELARRQSHFRHCHRFFFDEFRRRTRSFSSSSSHLNRSIINDHPDSWVLVEENASSRTVLLNRPSFLNALNAPMMKKLHKLYESWEHNPNVGFVVMKGNGNAFSAGGDLVAMLDNIKKGNIEGTKEIFWRAYKFIYLVHTYLKPNVAILNGIAMGGGAGVSVPGTFRIVTDKTVFATPETLVGFHTDGGASFYLSHLPGHLGEYLGLTADRLNGAEMMACGLATHYSHSKNVGLLEQHLKNLVADDTYVLGTFLQKYTDHFDYLDDNSVLKRMEMVNKCFSKHTVEEIIDALESEAARTHDGWCFWVLKRLKYASPLSLKVTLRSIREGRFQTLDQCLIREYRMTIQGISGQISSDFTEGVRARMIDKDFAPKWDPPSLKHVSQDMVDQYFSPLSAREPELDLPVKEEEAVAEN